MVKVLRPLVPRGLKPHFATYLLQKVLRDNTLNRIMQNLDGNEVPSACDTEFDSNSVQDGDASIDSDNTEFPNCAPLLFRRYGSRAVVNHYLMTGLPVSVVFTNRDNIQRLGVIVSMCNRWVMLPLKIGHMMYEDDLGFDYFNVTLHGQAEELLVREKQAQLSPTYHVKLINYGLLLPAQWMEAPCPYALMTMEGKYLDKQLSFV